MNKGDAIHGMGNYHDWDNVGGDSANYLESKTRGSDCQSRTSCRGNITTYESGLSLPAVLNQKESTRRVDIVLVFLGL